MRGLKQELFSDFHFNSMKKTWYIILLCFAACTSKLMVPPAFDLKKMQTKVPEITIEKATKGHALYVEYCGTCHHLYEPSKFTDKKWSALLIEMIPRAKVRNLTEQQLIVDYVKSLSK